MLLPLLRRPIGVLLITTTLALLGLLAAGRLPLSLLPTVSIPGVSVQVAYPGAAAATVQHAVVEPLRAALLQVNNIEDLRAEARDEAASFQLAFPFGTDPDLAFIEINEKIDRAMNALPRGVERPRVLAADVSDIPFVDLAVTLRHAPTQDPGAGTDAALLALSELSRTTLRRRLEQLPGIAFADLSGQLAPRLVIRPRPGVLTALGLEEEELGALLAAANVELGGLVLRDGAYQYNVRFASTLRGAADVRRLYVPLRDRRTGNVLRTVPLTEIATVTEEATPPRGAYYFDGRRGVVFSIRKRDAARLFALQEELATLVADLRTTYPELRFDLVGDQTAILRASVTNLASGLAFGAAFAVAVLFVFFREWQRPLLIAVAVPVALLITLLGFYLVGVSLNVVSLAGLILGLGLMIDNSIIVVDNLPPGVSAAADHPSVAAATNEVIRPLISSALTTVAVFLPLVLLSGVAGALFTDQALAVSLSLAASLLAAYFVLPTLFVRLGGAKNASRSARRAAVEKSGSPPAWPVLLGSGVWLGVGVLLLTQLPRSGFPDLSRTEYSLRIDHGTPIALPDLVATALSVLPDSAEWPPYRAALLAGEQSFALAADYQAPTTAELRLYFTEPPPEGFATRYLATLRTVLPTATCALRPAPNLFDRVFSTTEPWVELRLRPTRGNSLPERSAVDRLVTSYARAGAYPTVPATQTALTLGLAHERLRLNDVEPTAVRRRLSSLFGANLVTSLRVGTGPLPVYLTAGGELTETRLRSATITNGAGREVPLATLLHRTSTLDYRRLASDRAGVYLPLVFPAATDPGVVRRVLESAPEFTGQLRGRFLTDRDRLRELGGILPLSLFVLLLILAAQFESLVLPLLILLVVPLSLVGSLVALWLTGSGINLISLIGMVVTGGIVVNDAIIKVDMIQRGRNAGLPLAAALRQANRRRLRAILMTSLSTVLALLPVLFSGGLGAELQRPLALAVIGGLTVGTLASLYVLPVLYRVVMRK